MRKTEVRVFVTRRLPDAIEAAFEQHFDVRLSPDDRPLTRDQVAEALCSADVLVSTVSEPIDASLLNLPDRRVGLIANVAVGYNHIDVEAARAAGVVVTNTPDVLTDATADIALLLMLASTRRAREHEQRLREGRWQGFSLVDGLGTGLQGKTLGIIGMGRIGQATAHRAQAGFGMQVVYFNRSPVLWLSFPATALDSVEAVLAEADVVSLHAPGGGGALITAERLALMKPEAHLINTARGELIDEPALIDALQKGRLAGAGLDVFAQEPRVPEALAGMDKVTLLPHIGSATRETREAMARIAFDNVLAHVEGHDYPSRVV